MLDNNVTLLTFLIINTFIIGFFVGRSTVHNGVYKDNKKPKSFFRQQKSNKQETNSISIDDKKFVVDIKTEDLEKKYDSLGEISKSPENITNSINKLKNLKG
jgi:hypothetical protein